MSEFDPVDAGEFVYRRIAPIYCDESLPIAIQREAFRPTASDTTGLSVFRARFAQPADALSSLDPAKAAKYFVSRLSVNTLLSLGLTVVPDPLPEGPPDHAEIPVAYQDRKHEIKSILLEIARHASTNIVHQPTA